MGGEQAAGVLAQITKDQRAREGKPVREIYPLRKELLRIATYSLNFS